MANYNRRIFIFGSGAVVLTALTGCNTFSDFGVTSDNARDETANSLPFINALRSEHGLSTLSYDKPATMAAMDQAARMAHHGKMEHNIGIGANFLKRMQGQNVGLPAAENIAVGQDSAARAFDAWRNSHKHLVNMLGDYRGLGVAVAYDPASGNRPYWAMVLSN